MRTLLSHRWTSLRPLRAATLSLALLVAACEAEQGPQGAPGTAGEQGPKGDPGTSATVDPALSPVDKAFAGLGGRAAIQDLRGYELEISGQRWVPGEGYAYDADLIVGNTYEGTRISHDVAGSRLTLHHKRTLKAFGGSTAQDYKEIINGTRGYVDGIEQFFGFPTGNLPADRTAAILRQTRLLNPHLLLKDIAASASLARDGGAALLDGAVHHLVVVNDSVHPLTLYVNAQTGRISKLVTLENDPLHRDVPIEVFYLGWEPVTGGPSFPRNVYLSSNGHLLHAENRTKVTANPTFAESTFQFPAAASPVDNAEDAARGAANHQFHLTFASVGIPLDGLQTAVVPTKVSDGVWFLGGSSHNSLAIEQANGIVILEAPLYPERSTAIINWVKGFAEFDSKPITHVLATHHHDDHTAGLRAFVAEGARVVVHESTAPYFRQIFTNPSTLRKDPLANNFVPATLLTVAAGGSRLLADADLPVTAYSFETTHARDMLLFYVGGSAKVAFSSDLFNPGMGGIGNGPRELYEAITETHALEVTTVAGGHGTTSPLSALRQAAGL